MRIFTLLFLFVVTTFAAQSEYMIVPSPASFSILNHFNQPLTDKDKAAFYPNAPWKIISHDELLGDQITHASRFSYLGEEYFLLKDDSGKLIGTQAKNNIQMLKGCTGLDDTIQVAKAQAVQFSTNLSSGNGQFLPKASVLHRSFQYNGKFYCLLLSAAPRFGWCTSLESNAMATLKSAPKEEAAPQGLTPELLSKLISRIESANKCYRDYFEHFNKLTGQEKSAPFWKYDHEGQGLKCELKGPPGIADQLQESTHYLVQDLQNILISKNCVVTSENGIILIAQKR